MAVSEARAEIERAHRILTETLSAYEDPYNQAPVGLISGERILRDALRSTGKAGAVGRQLAPGVHYEDVRGWFQIHVELSNDGPGWEVLIGGSNPMEATAAGYGSTPGAALDAAMADLSSKELVP